jgi:protein O-mannosyl-transferase
MIKKIKHYFNKERLLIALVVFVFYGNTLQNEYSLDDSIVTEAKNMTAKGVKAIPKILTSNYIESSEDFMFDYRPMVKVSFAIEHELFGLKTGVSHFFNILFYLIGLFLLYSCLLLLFDASYSFAALCVVLLFAIMPIHTEVVASLKNRDILLTFIFCMLALKKFIQFHASDFKKWKYLCLTLFFYYLAYLSKLDALPFMVIIPVIVLLKNPKQYKWIAVFVFTLLISYILFKVTKKSIFGSHADTRIYYTFENPLYFKHELKYKLIATFNSLGFYINQIIFPYKQCCYYGTDTIPVEKLSIHGYLGIIAAPLIIIGLVKCFFKKNYVLFYGLLIFCASCSMYLNLAKPAVGIVADRFAFFSSLGVAIAIIGLLLPFLPSFKLMHKNIKLVFGIVLLVFAFITINRNADWNNVYTIIAADYTKYPNNAYLNYKQGMNIIKIIEKDKAMLTADVVKTRLLEARKLLEKSIEVEPNYANSRNYLSYVLVYLINDFAAALPHINSSIAYKETIELYYYKGICMRELKQKDSCEFYLKKCITMDNSYYNAYGLLMYDYNLNKEFQKSIDMFNEALSKGIKTESIYNGLGKTYWQMNNNVEAKKYYQKALDINPNNEESAAMVKRL